MLIHNDPDMIPNNLKRRCGETSDTRKGRLLQVGGDGINSLADCCWRMASKLWFACLVCSFLAHVFAMPSGAQTPADRADSIHRMAMKDRKIPGLQAAVIASGEVVFSRNYGVANLQTPVSVTDDTVFSINSVTKAFTGVAVMQEVE